MFELIECFQVDMILHKGWINCTTLHVSIGRLCRTFVNDIVGLHLFDMYLENTSNLPEVMEMLRTPQ